LKSNPLKFIIAVVGGVIAAFITTAILHKLGPSILGYEQVPVKADSREFMAYMDRLPVKALVYMGLAYCFGSLIGSFVAARYSPDKKPEAGMTVGLFQLVMGIFFFISLEHPLDFSILVSIGFLAFATLGTNLAIKSKG